MTVHTPETPQNPPEPPPDPGPPTNQPATTAGSPPPTATPTGDDHARTWAAVGVVALFLGSTIAMLLTDHVVNESLLLAAGVTLLSIAIARRILANGPLLPTIAIACVVAAFAVVLLVLGYQISDVAAVCGCAGLLAGEVTAWAVRPPAPRRGA
jgi:hypothetical protein